MATHLGRPLRVALRKKEQQLAIAVAGLIVVLFPALPLLRLIGEAVTAGAAALAVWSSAAPWRLLGRSLVLAGAVTVCALAIGTAMGVLIARCEMRARRVLWALHAFPLFLPPFLLALGWFQTFGQSAPFGSHATSRLLFSEAGVVVVLTFAFTPVATSLVVLALLGLDASLEEAARAIARPRYVIRQIFLPTVRPTLVLAGIVIFALTVSEVGVPMFLRVDVFSAAVFSRLGGMSYAPGEAVALSAPLVGIAALLLFVERRFAGRDAFGTRGLRAMSRTPLPLGRSRTLWEMAAWAVAGFGLVPLAALAYVAIRGGGFGALTESLGNSLAVSLGAAIPAAVLLTMAGVMLGHAIARRFRGATALDALCMLAFLTPAPVLGVGLISVWVGESTRALYGSIAILAIGYATRYAAIAVRATTAVIAQSPVRLEEAAAATGAWYWRRLMCIVVPANGKSIMAVGLLVAVFCLRDLETAVLYYPPGFQPLPVRILTLEANGAPPVVAALALTHVLLTGLICALGLRFLLERRTA